MRGASDKQSRVKGVSRSTKERRCVWLRRVMRLAATIIYLRFDGWSAARTFGVGRGALLILGGLLREGTRLVAKEGGDARAD